MKPDSQNVGNDPTILGNERPRRSDELPEGETVQEEDPRNGMNPASDDTLANRPGEDEDED